MKIKGDFQLATAYSNLNYNSTGNYNSHIVKTINDMKMHHSRLFTVFS